MSDPAREAFLAHVRQAVQEGNRAGSPPLPERGTLGYQGAGQDHIAHFCRELETAGGKAHRVAGAREALSTVLGLVRSASARRILLGGALPDGVDLAGPLTDAGCEVVCVEGLNTTESRDPFFAADLGISGAHALIAETGSIVVVASPAHPRSLSLLPPLHVVVARREQLLPDLFDLFQPARWPDGLPSGLSIITGPSKTGDIELRLVTGVHGPGEVHVVLIDSPGQGP